MTNPSFFPCCEWAEKLAVYASKELSLADREALDVHLTSCLACKAVLNEYQALDERLHEALQVRWPLQVSSASLHIEGRDIGEEEDEAAQRGVITPPTFVIRSTPKSSFVGRAVTFLIIGLIISGFSLLSLTSRLRGTMTDAASTITPAVAHVTPIVYPENSAYVRVILASPYVGEVDVFVAGHELLSSFQFAAVTNYVPIPSSTHEIQIALVGKGIDAATLSQTLTVQAGLYTVAALGTSANSLSLKMFVDTDTFVSDRGIVRIYNFSPDSTTFTVIPVNNKRNSNLQQTDSNFVLPAGNYTVQVRSSLLNKTMTSTITVKVNTVTSVFLVGTFDGSPKLQIVFAQIS